MNLFEKVTRRSLIRTKHLNDLRIRAASVGTLANFLRSMPEDQMTNLLATLDDSKSQFQQDLFGMVTAGFKRGGYFVEFGAASGVQYSNSWMMEKCFGWSGIVSEPAHVWHDKLARSRTCHVETDCVWKATGEQIEFLQNDHGMLSAISGFGKAEGTVKGQAHVQSYSVRTISLMDMLDKYDAPEVIDFLSVDTEGSEFEILSAFDFSTRNIRAMVIEHNHKPQREDLYNLLTKNGYLRVLTHLSGPDDWYVRPGETVFG